MRVAREPQAILGRALRDLRLTAGLTQEELAHRAGLHPTWISKIEKGHNNPAWGTVVRLVDGAGASLGDLVERIDAIELE